MRDLGVKKVTYKLPSRKVKHMAIFWVRPMCSFSTFEIGTAKIHMSPNRLMIPTPR
jgi:hypothetical protein